MTAKGSEHLVIFTTSTLQPNVAAKEAIALTTVVQIRQEELYPFFQIYTEPELSTQNLTGRPRNRSIPAAKAKSGPNNSKADKILSSRRPEASFTKAPLLIAGDQGT